MEAISGQAPLQHFSFWECMITHDDLTCLWTSAIPAFRMTYHVGRAWISTLHANQCYAHIMPQSAGQADQHMPNVRGMAAFPPNWH